MILDVTVAVCGASVKLRSLDEHEDAAAAKEIFQNENENYRSSFYENVS